MTTNIIIAGVGGQGLVLMTKVLSQAAMNEGYDVKTNDVIGLAQRGGMVWGSVRFGEKIFSPNIRIGSADYLLGLEQLEALRWAHILKPDGKLILNTAKIYPTIIQQEKAQYPDAEIENLKSKFDVLELDAMKIAKEAGNKQMANIVLLGAVSNFLDIKLDCWENAIKQNLKESLHKLNLDVFNRVRELIL